MKLSMCGSESQFDEMERQSIDGQECDVADKDPLYPGKIWSTLSAMYVPRSPCQGCLCNLCVEQNKLGHCNFGGVLLPAGLRECILA